MISSLACLLYKKIPSHDRGGFHIGALERAVGVFDPGQQHIGGQTADVVAGDPSRRQRRRIIIDPAGDISDLRGQ